MRKEQGIAHILLLILLLAGIVAGVYLIQNKTNFFSRASASPIVFKSSTGAALPVNSQNIPQSTSPTVKIEFTSSLGPPKSNTTVSGPVKNYTVSFKFAEDPISLDKARAAPYTMEPYVVTYTFKNQNPGTKFIWAEFKDNTGKVERKTAQLELIAATSLFSNLTATFAQKQATFNFTYTGPRSTLFRIDVSTLKDMSWDVYGNFAEGRTSPVVQTNPTRWDKYSCNKVLYWRVYDNSRKVSSPIQTTTVKCDTATPTPSASLFSNLSASLGQTNAQFNFTYSGQTSNYRVDLSTRSDMSWDVYVDFGQGSKSPVAVSNPTKWDKYKCGATLYWRVYDNTKKVSSPIQTSTIVCAISPVVQSVNPTSLPSNYVQLGQTTLEVNGSGFQPGIAVMFYKTGYSGPLPVVNSVTSTQIKVTLSAGMNPGYYSISVQNTDRLGYNKADVLLITSQVVTPTPTPQSAKRVFVTSTTYNGNLGGLTGADAKCQARANAVNLGGTWKAWLSDGSISASSRLSHSNSSYLLVKDYFNRSIANNWSDLVDGSDLAVSLATDESGKMWTTYLVWTNTNINGGIDTRSVAQGTGHCNNWTSSSSSDTGKVGSVTQQSPNWTADPSLYKPCSMSLIRLYCFEQ